MKKIINIIKKEFLQFKRDPKMFAIILVAPIIQLTFLGFAANLDVENVETCVLDYDNSKTSRELINKLEASGYFNITSYVDDYDEITENLETGENILAIVIDNDFEKDLLSKRTAKLQGIFDGADGNKGLIAGGYLQGFVQDYAMDIQVDYALKNGSHLTLPSDIVPVARVWYNPELKTRIFMVPGIVGLLLMIITLLLTSLAVVKEKEIGTMEQLVVTPIKPRELIIGKMVPFMILGMVSVVIVLTAMSVIFGIEVRGSVLFLFFSTFIFIFSTLGLGLFASTISKTQQQAMMIAIFAMMMPMIYLSGFAFPIENMPKFIQYFSYAIPLTYFNTIIRGIILKGIGFAELWQELLIMLMLGILILIVSASRFKKRID